MVHPAGRLLAAPLRSASPQSAPDSWTSAVSGNWANAANWSAGVPNSGSDVTIAAAGPYTVTIDAPEIANSLTLNSSAAALALTSTGALSVTGGVSIVHGTLSLASGAALTAATVGLSTTATLTAGAGGGTSTIAALFSNSGTVSIGSGTLALTGGGSLGGSIIGSGLLSLAGGAFTGNAAAYATANLAIANASLGATATGTLTGSLAITGHGTLAIRPGVTLATAGPVALGQAGTNYSGAATVMGAGTLTTAGLTTIANAANQTELALGNALVWNNTGTVNDSGAIALNLVANDKVTIVNQAGAQFALLSDNAGFGTINAGNDSFINSGTLTKSGGIGTSLFGATLTSTGLVSVATGTLQLDGGGALVGMFSGAGVLELGGGNFAEQGARFALASLAVDNGATLTIAAADTLGQAIAVNDLGSLTITSGLSAKLTGPLSFGLPGGGANAKGFLLGGGTLTTAGITTINDDSGQVALTLGRSLVWQNAGTIQDSGIVALNVFQNDQVSLFNQTGAVFNLLTDHASVTVVGAGNDQFTNAGTLAKTGGTGTSVIGDVFTSTGRIDVATGTLQLAARSTLTGSLSGAGVLELSGNAVTEQGGLLGGGTLVIDNAASLTLAGADTLTPAIAVNGLGTLTVANGVDATVAGALSFGLAGAPYNGAGNLLGPGTLTTTGTTTINDNGNQAALILGRIATWINDGVVQQAGLAVMSQGVNDRVSIVNQAGASFNLLSDRANLTLPNGGKASFVNAGTLAKLGGAGTSLIGAVLTGSGLINVANGTLQLNAGGTLAGTLIGPGTLELVTGTFAEQSGLAGHGNLAVDGGATLTLLAADTLTPSIALNGAGGLGVAAGQNATLTGPLAIGLAGTGYNGAGNLFGPGTLTTTGATTIAADPGQIELALGRGVTWINAGTVQDNGIIALNFALGDKAILVNQAGAVFNLASDAAGLGVSSAGNNALTNAGTLEKTGGTGTSVIAAALTSTGLIDVAVGTLQLTAAGTLSGTLNGAGVLELSGGPFNEQGSLLGTGNLTLDNAASFTVTASSTLAPAIAITANSTLTVLTGVSTTVTGPLSFGAVGGGPGNLFGFGTLTTTGVTSIADITSGAGLNLGHTISWINAGTVQDGGGISLNLVANDRVFMQNQAGAVFNLLTDDAGITVTSPGSDSVTNAGTLAKTGGSGTSVINTVFTSSGRIDVATGTLQLQGHSVLSGSLSGAGILELSGTIATEQGGLLGAGNLTIDNATTLSIAASDTINPAVAVNGGSTLALANGIVATLNGPLGFRLAGSGATVLGPGTLTTTGITTIADHGGQAALTLGRLITWANAGTVQDSGLAAINVGGSDRVNITNQAGATFNLLSDSAGFAPLAVGFDQFTNAGTLAKTGGAGASVLALAFTNTGVIDVATGTLLLDAGGTLTGTLAGAGTLELALRSFTEQGGVAGNGTLAVDNGAVLTLMASDTLAPTLMLNGLGTLTMASGVHANLAGPVDFGLAGAAYNGTGTVSGPGTLTTSGTTTIADSAGQIELTVGHGLTWINAGTILDNGLVLLNFAATDLVTLINQAGAVFDLGTDDAGLTGTLAAGDSLINAGTLEKTGGTGTSIIAAGLTNTGLIDVAVGTLQLTGPGAFAGTLTGSGTLELSGGPFTEQGGLSGGGALTIDNGSVLSINGNDTLTPSISVVANGRLLVATGISATLNGALAFGSVGGAGNLFGLGTVTTSASTGIAEFSGGPGLNLGHGITWLNAGVVQDSGGIDLNVIPKDKVSIVNLAGAVFNLLTNDAGLFVTSPGSDSFTNAGTLAKSGGSGTSVINTPFTSSGRIDVATGTLQVAANGTLGGTLSGAGMLELNGTTTTEQGGLLGGGNLTLDNGGTLTIAANDTINPAVTIDAGGTLMLATGIAATLNGPVDFGMGNSPGALFGAGTLTTTGTTSLSANPGQVALTLARMVSWVNAGTVLDGAAATMNVGINDRIGIANQAGAVFNLLNDSAGLAPLVAGTDSFVNAGTLEKTGGSGTSTIAIAVDSTGLIDVQTGTLALTGGGTLSGTLAGAGVLDLGGTPFVSDAPLAAGGTLLLHRGGSLSLTAAGSLTGTVVISGNATLALAAGISLAGPGALILGQPTGHYDGIAVLSGPGTLATTGTTTITDTSGQTSLSLGGGIAWTNAGTINASGAATLNAFAGDKVSLVNQSGAILNLLTDDAGFSAPIAGTDTVANAGTIEKTGGTGVSLISAVINNTGVIDVQSGTLELDGGGTIGGTLRGGGVLGLGFGSFNATPTALRTGNLLIHNAATLALAASGTLTGADQIDGNATLSLGRSAQILSTGTLSFGAASGYGALAGPGTLTTTGLSRINDGSSGSQLELGNSIVWHNAGTVADSGAIYLGLLTNDAAVLVNQTRGVFNLLTDDAGIAGLTQGTYSLTNAGLFSKTGGTGASNVFVNLTNSGTFSAASGTLRLISTVNNSGTLLARNGAALDLSFANLLNLSGGTLSRGSYEADSGATLLLASPNHLVTDAARITLSGAGSVLAVFDTTTGSQINLENSLSSIAATGTLAVAAGRVFAEAAANFSVAGSLSLSGGSFIGAGIAIAGNAGGSGTLQGALTVSGSIAASGGTLTLAGSLTGAGTLSARAGATLNLATGGTLTETIAGPGGLALTGGSYSLTAGSTLAMATLLVANDASLSGPGSATATVSAALTNVGTITSGLGQLAFLASATNNGTMTATGGALSFNGRVTGAGQIDIGNSGTESLLNGAGSGQTINFLASTGLLDLGTPAAFSGTIAGFGAADHIDLLSTTATNFSYSAGTLHVLNGSAEVASLAFSGNYAANNFTLATDSQGGTLISFQA